jgi:hypothetical protein
MFKRAIARLLLFGVPFTFGYLATRPARQNPSPPQFVICAHPNGEMTVSPSGSACGQGSAVLVPAGRTLSDPAANADPSLKLPF